MKHSATSALALAFALAACIGPRPKVPPAASVAPPSAWRDAATSEDPIDAQWWRSFGDPRLTELVERARANNTNIAISATRVAEARAAVRGARIARGPEIDAQVAGSYAKTVTLGIPVTALGTVDGVTASWDTDLFGRLASASDAAKASLLASRASHGAVVLSVESATAETYIELLGADARLAVLEETLQSRQRSLDLAQKLRKGGYSSDLELRQAEGELRATSQLIPTAKAAITRLENALSVLTGDAPGSIARDSSGLSKLTLPVVPIALPSALVGRRPDLVAAEDELVAADHSLDSARAAMLPNFKLAASGNIFDANVLPHSFDLFSLAGSVLAPILGAGRHQAEADAAAARRDRAAFAYRATALNAFKEVEDGMVTLNRLGEQRVEVLGAVDAQTGALKVATLRYSSGYASYFNQLDAERQLLSARLTLVQADTDRLVSTVQLYRALGGGWTLD